MISKVLLLPAFALTLALTLTLTFTPIASAEGLVPTPTPAITSAAATPAGARAVTITYLKSKPDHLTKLERFIRANWFVMDEAAVKQGLFVSYEWLDTATDEGPWNAIVTVTYADDKGFEGIKQQWAAIKSAHKEVRPDGLSLKELGQVLETKNLLERAPFTKKQAARAALATMMSADTEPVRAAVERYFKAADSANADAVRSVFWPSGRVEGVGGGKFLSWSADEFATRNFRGQPNTNQEINRTIEWLDVSGTGAVARVKVQIDKTKTYWDYFILHKINGDWKIGLKAFANPERIK